MNAITDRDAYKNILDVVKELIKSTDIDDMVMKLNTSVQSFMPGTIVFAGLWDKYEEELQIFSVNKNVDSDIVSFFKFMLKNEKIGRASCRERV